MIIYSEILNKEFDSVDACLDAELAFKRKEKEKKEAEEKRQKTLDEAYQKAINACEEYLKLAGIDMKVEECKCGCDDDFDWLDEILESFMDSWKQKGHLNGKNTQYM